MNSYVCLKNPQEEEEEEFYNLYQCPRISNFENLYIFFNLYLILFLYEFYQQATLSQIDDY